jgi:hypothetical protein
MLRQQLPNRVLCDWIELEVLHQRRTVRLLHLRRQLPLLTQFTAQ